MNKETVTLSLKALLDGLAKVKFTLPKAGSFALLKAVLIEVNGNNVYLSTTDQSIGLTAKLECVASTNFAVCLDFAALLEALEVYSLSNNAQKEKQEVVLEQESDSVALVIYAGKAVASKVLGKYTFSPKAIFSPIGFPKALQPKQDDADALVGEWDTKTLSQIIEATLPYWSREDKRPFLQYVDFQPKSENLTEIVAADGYQFLAMRTTKLRVKRSLQIFGENLKLLLTLLKKEEVDLVKVYVDSQYPNKVIFAFGSLIFNALLGDVALPNVFSLFSLSLLQQNDAQKVSPAAQWIFANDLEGKDTFQSTVCCSFDFGAAHKKKETNGSFSLLDFVTRMAKKANHDDKALILNLSAQSPDFFLTRPSKQNGTYEGVFSFTEKPTFLVCQEPVDGLREKQVAFNAQYFLNAIQTLISQQASRSNTMINLYLLESKQEPKSKMLVFETRDQSIAQSFEDQPTVLYVGFMSIIM